jgi:uncharacterized protein YfdQ (DUF2303 family)
MDAFNTDVQAAVEAGKDALETDKRVVDFEIDDTDIPVAIVRNGEQAKVLTDIIELRDQRAERPRRRKGTASFAELASFIDHVNRFKDADSAIFADISGPKLTAVLDYHKAGAESDPRWGQHRSVYAPPLSEQWRIWTAKDGVPMTQDEFAQFIEDHMDDLRSPPSDRTHERDLPAPSEVLTMARHLVVRTKGTFERSINPTTGEFALINKNENEQTSTKIPRAFLLGIPVFEAGAQYAVEARMRMAMGPGGPRFAYSLYQPNEIKRHAFDEVRTMAAERTGLPMFAGSPE